MQIIVVVNPAKVMGMEMPKKEPSSVVLVMTNAGLSAARNLMAMG